MEAQVWTLIAILVGTIMSMMLYLGSRIDRQDSRFDRVDARFDRLDTRFEELSTRVEDQGRQLADHIYELGKKLDEHLRRHAS